MPRRGTDHDQFPETVTRDSLRILKRKVKEQATVSRGSSERNPNTAKESSTVPDFLQLYRERASVKLAATETAKFASGSQGAVSTEPLSNREEMRVNSDGGVLSQAGGGTNSLQSSSSYNLVLGPPGFLQLLTEPLPNREEIIVNADGGVPGQATGGTNSLQSGSPYNLVLGPPRFSQLETEPLSNREEMGVNGDGGVNSRAGGGKTPLRSSSPYNLVPEPPRFSQLLAQASLSNPSPPVIATQSKSGKCSRKSTGTSKSMYRRQSPQPVGSTVQDDHRQDTVLQVGATNLREQIVACLLDPDFVDFVAEVEKVWDELEGTIAKKTNI